MSIFYLFRDGVLINSHESHASYLHDIGQPGDLLIRRLPDGTLLPFDWQRIQKNVPAWQPILLSFITEEIRLQILLHG